MHDSSALESEEHLRSHTEASTRPPTQGSLIRNKAHDLARATLEDCCSLATSGRGRGVFVNLGNPQLSCTGLRQDHKQAKHQGEIVK